MVSKSSPPDLRVGVIGLGLRANLLDVAHRPGHGSVVSAVCDLDPGVLARQSGRLDPAPRATTSWHDLVHADDVDAVVVATPDHTHEELVVAALRAGKPTFAEKPLAITIESCDRILATAKETGTRLYVGHNMRHFAMVRRMKSLIDAGAIGEVQAVWCRHFVGHGGDFYFKDWHAQRRNVTSLLLQKGAHDIDVIHWLAGSSSRTVHGFGRLAVYDRVTDRHDGDKRADWFDPQRHWPPLAQSGLHPRSTSRTSR